jgi:hypothetical protein
MIQMYRYVHFTAWSIWQLLKKIFKFSSRKKDFCLYRNPWEAKNFEVLIEFFHQVKKILIFIIKKFLENNEEDQIAGSAMLSKCGIRVWAWEMRNKMTESVV